MVETLESLEQFSKTRNLDFAYEYTRDLLQMRLANFDKLNTRLGAFLAFGGVVLRFAFDSPGSIRLADSWVCYTCLGAKILVFAFAVAAIWVSGTELRSSPTNGMINPKKLMADNLFHAEQGRGKAFIVNTWIQTLEEIEPQLLDKGKRLNQTIILLSLAVTTLAIDMLIASVFN